MTTFRERAIERLRRFLRPPRRILPTRAGVMTLGAPFLLGVAAINASNNLLFLLLGACLGLIVLSGILSERSISSVDAEIASSGQAYAAEDARLIVTVQRLPGKRARGPVFGLRVRERRRRGPVEGRLDARLPIVEGSSCTAVALRRFERRGRRALGPCEILTTYPFGLLTKARDLDATCEIIVRPRRMEVPQPLADPRGLAVEGPSSARRGVGPDVYGLREWDMREPPRRIHALRSARLGREVVVETEASNRPVAWIAVANLSGADPEAFERALEVVQATAEAWDRLGYAVALRAASWQLAPGTPLDVILDALAVLELEPAYGGSGLVGSLWIVPEGAPLPPDAEGSTVASVSTRGSVSLTSSEEAAA